MIITYTYIRLIHPGERAESEILYEGLPGIHKLSYRSFKRIDASINDNTSYQISALSDTPMSCSSTQWRGSAFPALALPLINTRWRVMSRAVPALCPSSSLSGG